MIKDTRFRDTLNFRQLGGYMTTEGRTVKENVFYRSGAPFRMNESELEALKQLGLYAIMDLRSNEEILQRPDPELSNILMIKHSGAISEGGEEINFSSEGMNRIGEGGREQLALLKKYYARMPFNNQAFRIMFEHIQKGDVPILIHCASGKDRTGVACMLILLALGVDRETVLEDYILTNVYRRNTIQKKLEEDKDIILAHPEREELDRMTFGVTKEIGNIVLDTVYNAYGRLEEYFEKEFNINQEELQRLRSLYTE